MSHLPDPVAGPLDGGDEEAALDAVSGACRIAGTRAWPPSLMSWAVMGVGATTVLSGMHRVGGERPRGVRPAGTSAYLGTMGPPPRPEATVTVWMYWGVVAVSSHS
jgi:hypothetical protein